jgi:hypothetical protein
VQQHDARGSNRHGMHSTVARILGLFPVVLGREDAVETATLLRKPDSWAAAAPKDPLSS